MYRRQLAACNYSTKGYKKTRYDTVTADDLDISTWAIYFACWPMNRIGGGQHGAVSIALRHFVWLNFPCAQHEANNMQLILSSMNNCNFIAVRYCTHADAQELLCIAWNKMSRNFLLLVNTQHTHSSKSHTTCRLWRQMPVIKDVFHPASYTVDHPLSGVTGKVHSS